MTDLELKLLQSLKTLSDHTDDKPDGICISDLQAAAQESRALIWEIENKQ